MAKFLSGRIKELLLGVVGYTENNTVLQTTGKVGIGTTNAQQHSLFVVGSTNITGDTIVGGGFTAVGIGSFENDVYIDQQLYVDGITISEDISARHLYLSGIATVTDLTDLNGGLEVTGVSTFSSDVDINASIDVDGHTELDDLNVSGFSTFVNAADFNGGLTANEATVENLTNDRIVLAGVGGRLEDSPNLTFDGNILNVVGHTELDNVNVSGTATITSLDVQTNFDVYDGTATFHNNVYITGNLSIGGTTTVLQAQDLQIFDKDIILGVTTDSNGNDISTDITANHAGVAVASTEGNPLVDLYLEGLEELPTTYKKIMWFSEGSFSGLGTDAWLFNYAVGIGSTQFPSGTRLAAGQIRISEDTIDTPNLDVSRHTELDTLNTTGISTFGDRVIFDSTNSIQIPSGTTAERDVVGVAVTGQIRYNSEYSTFEGFGPGNAWGSLGGVKDVNQDTYIIPEVSPGSNEDTLYFYTGGFLSATISSEAFTINVPIGIGTDFKVTGITTFTNITDNTLGNPDTGAVQIDGGLGVNKNVTVGAGLSVVGGFNVAGVSTFQDNINLGDNNRIRLGISSDLQIYHNGVNSWIQDTGSGNLKIAGDDVEILSANGASKITATTGGSVDLYHNTVKRLETTGYGVTVYSDLRVGTAVTIYGNAGIVSAISFYGDGANLTNTGASLSASSGSQRLVLTSLTSGTMTSASTDGDLTFNANHNLLSVPSINVSTAATFGGTVSAGGTVGIDGQYLRSTGVGVTWVSAPSLRTTQTNIATDGQTVFSFVYNVNYIDVYVNGVKLAPSEYISTSGSQVVLISPAFEGDVVEFISYNTTSIGGGSDFATKNVNTYTATSNQTTFAATYAIGFVDVYLNGSKLSEDQYTATSGSDIVLNSGATAGDIVEVVGLQASLSTVGVTIQDEGSPLSGSGTVLNFVGDGVVASGSGATKTITISGGGSVGAGGTWATDDVGINTTKSVGIGTTAKSSYSLYVEGDARVTGILTVGPASVTIDGINNEVVVGAGITLYGNTGIISATSLIVSGSLTGSGAGLTGLTGASASIYGNGTAVPQITVDANGRITNISNVLISGGGGGGSSIIIRDSQALVGTAGTIDFGTGLSVTPVSVGIVTVTVSNDSITHAKYQNIATSTILGRVTASSGDPEELTATQVRTLINVESGADVTDSTNVAAAGAVMDGDFTSNGFMKRTGAGSYTVDTNTYLTATGDGSGLTGIGVTVAGTWTLESGDGSDYVISGPGLDGNESDPTIYVRRGQVYQFVNSTGGHPFQIQYEGGNTSGTAYNDGIINNNAGNDVTLHWNVHNDAPDVLYYQCTAHTDMWGKIIVLGDVVSEGSWTATAGVLENIDTITGVANNDFKTAEYTLHIEHASGMQAQKVLSMQTGSTAYSQEFAIMYDNNLLVSIGASISGGNFHLNATPESGISGITTYRFTRQTIR